MELPNGTWRYYCAKLLADVGGGMITTMARDRSQHATPDLFTSIRPQQSTFLPSEPVDRASEARDNGEAVWLFGEYNDCTNYA